MTAPSKAPFMINGWTLLAHPLFLDAYAALLDRVERQRAKNPQGYLSKKSVRRLAAVNRLIYEAIPASPGGPEFRLGHSLGREYAHWFRAKFFQQYRLFFRYHAGARLIVYVWMNDENNLRAYESDSDAYLVFGRMLGSGRPPDNWDQLLRETLNAQLRFHELLLESQSHMVHDDEAAYGP